MIAEGSLVSLLAAVYDEIVYISEIHHVTEPPIIP